MDSTLPLESSQPPLDVSHLSYSGLSFLPHFAGSYRRSILFHRSHIDYPFSPPVPVAYELNILVSSSCPDQRRAHQSFSANSDSCHVHR
jgi:hypothetical protein